MQEITQTGESYAAPNESEPAPQVSTSGNSIAAWRGVGFALGSLILAFAAQAYFEGQRQYSWGGAFLYAGAVVLFLLAVLGIEGIDIHPPSRDSLAKWRRDIVVELRNLWLWVAVPQEDGLGQAPGPGIGTSPGELPQDHIGVGPDGDGESGPFEDKEGAPDQDARVHSHSTPSAGRWLRWRTAFEGLGFGRSAILPADQARSDDVGAKTAWRTCLVEWAAIFLVVLAFCSRFLDLGSRHVLNGNESEIVQALDWLLFKSITMHGQFPLWNPYLRAGQPFAADPFLHAYNPLATLPVIIFGVADGVKIALFLSFLFAGLGMWWLCKVSSVGTVVRVWAALSYAFTGQAVARFFQGEYDFVLGFAWIPWALAGLMAATETRRPRHIAVAVISMALLFFSGNVYYSFYMLLVVALFVPIALVRVKRQDPFLIFDRGKTWILLIIALLSVGLVAIQLLPLGEFWPRMAKQIDVEAKGAHSLGQILLDYLSTDARRADAVTTLPPEEFYSYTGLGPFVGFLLLPLAVWKRDKRLLLFLGLLLALVVAWVDIRDMPWRELYSRNGILNQFRYPTRILIYGACAIILLAALGLDSLWKLMRVGVERRAGAVQSAVRGSLPRVGPVVLCAFMVWSVADIYTHNRQVIGTHERYEISHDLVGWLAQHDNSLYYVGTPNNWHGPFFQNEVRNIDSWYGFEFVRYDPNMPGQRPVRARPNYVILGNDRAPVETDAVAVRRTATHTIYRLPSSLPYAFAIQNEKLSGAPQDREVQSNEVTAVTAVASGPNSVEIVSQGNSGSTLVVLSNMYPGWQVQVDGREQPLRNVGGYVAADLQPGLHKYVFTFSSTPFNLGLVISLLALIATLGLLVPDLLVGLRKTTQRLRTLSPSFGSISPRTAESWRGGSGGIRSSWLPVFNLLASSRKIDVLDKLGIILFILALGVYGLTRLLALDQFPIYFFSDEAVQTNLGLELVRRGFHDARGVFLPPFFPNGPYWNLSLTVYLQGIMASLFGSSIVVTRATSAILSLSSAVAVGLTCKLVFKMRFWWLSVLILATFPAWFLHSRTAFETVTMVSFYSWFVLFYLLYRCRSARYLYPAIVAGGAVFYSYANGQAIMAITALLLSISDFRYHFQNRRTVGKGLLLVLVLAVPYLRFRMEHPEAMVSQLRILDSYLLRNTPLPDKVSKFIATYAYGLSPNYWFFPNAHDLIRHQWRDSGNLPLVTLPFWLLGLAFACRRLRTSAYRTLLVATLAAPFGAALADISITRVLAFIIPASIFVTLGLDWVLSWAKSKEVRAASMIAGFLVGALAGLSMLQMALANGPLWYPNYGLYGMQWGAKQLFEVIPQYLKGSSGVHVYLTPTWANGTDIFLPFFVPNDSRVQTQNVDGWIFERRPLDDSAIFVMTPEEYRRAQASNKFKRIQIDRKLPYPNGQDGFFFVRLAYVDDVDRVFAAEKEARRRPVVEQATVGGESVTVRHSLFEAGRLVDILDGDTSTLVRVMEANPALVEFEFPNPHSFTGLSADFGHMDFTVSVSLYAGENATPATYSQTYRGLPGDPHIELPFGTPPPQVTRVRIEIQDLNSGERAKIHIREIALKQ